MIPVLVRATGYAAAVAELAPMAVRTDAVAGAVVVIPGTQRWWSETVAAERAGAAAVVVADPRTGPPEGDVPDTAIPVVIARRRLRADHTGDVGDEDAPRLVVADADGPSAGLSTWVPDVLGWCRVLSGGALEIEHASRTPRAVLAAAASSRGVPVSITLTLHAAGPAPACSLVSIAEQRTEVRWDEAAGWHQSTRVDARGRLIAAERFESVERLALRRAVEAVAANAILPDLAELCADTRAASDLLRSVAS